MMILNTTAALIDEIVERGLVPIEYRSMYGGTCVGCEMPEIVDTMDDLEMIKGVRCIAYNGRHFVAYWPAARWDESVAEYVAGATKPVANNT